MILDELEKNFGTTINLNKDFYWHIPSEEKYNIYKKPDLENLTMGQLSEDIKEIERLNSGESGFLVYYSLWLGEILSAIGEMKGEE